MLYQLAFKDKEVSVYKAGKIGVCAFSLFFYLQYFNFKHGARINKEQCTLTSLSLYNGSTSPTVNRPIKATSFPLSKFFFSFLSGRKRLYLYQLTVWWWLEPVPTTSTTWSFVLIFVLILFRQYLLYCCRGRGKVPQCEETSVQEPGKVNNIFKKIGVENKKEIIKILMRTFALCSTFYLFYVVLILSQCLIFFLTYCLAYLCKLLLFTRTVYISLTVR